MARRPRRRRQAELEPEALRASDAPEVTAADRLDARVWLLGPPFWDPEDVLPWAQTHFPSAIVSDAAPKLNARNRLRRSA